MYFKTITEFLQMGGYAFYVWSAYGIVLIFLLINLITPILNKKKFLRNKKINFKRNG